MTICVQNKSVVIWLKTCQLHSETPGLFISQSKLSKERFKPLDCLSVHSVFEEKPNCMKILGRIPWMAAQSGSSEHWQLSSWRKSFYKMHIWLKKDRNEISFYTLMNNYLFRYCLKPRQFKKENWQVLALPILCLK
jgi:hypothetical protein